MTHDHESMSDVFDDFLEEEESDRHRKQCRRHHEEHDED